MGCLWQCLQRESGAQTNRHGRGLVVGCMSHAACYMLHAVCCMSYAACCMAICYMLHGVRCGAPERSARPQPRLRIQAAECNKSATSHGRGRGPRPVVHASCTRRHPVRTTRSQTRTSLALRVRGRLCLHRPLRLQGESAQRAMVSNGIKRHVVQSDTRRPEYRVSTA
jgi:hypothetical protein